MALARLKQSLMEKTGKAAMTKYSAEFEEQITLLEVTMTQTTRMVDAIEDALKMFGSAGSSMNHYEAIADACNRLGQRLPRGAYSTTLLAEHAAHDKIGKLQRRLQKDAYDRVVLPLKCWLTDEYPKMHREIELLRKRRLDMDGTATAVASKESVERQARAQKARQEHEQQLQITQRTLDRLTAIHRHHAQCFGLLLELQRAYFAGAQALIIEALQHVNNAQPS